MDLNTGQPGPSANPNASQRSPAATHSPSSSSSPVDNSPSSSSNGSSSSSSNGASAPRLPHQQSSHAPQEASSSYPLAPQLQQATPHLWNRVLQLWPWYQHSPPPPQPPHTGQSTTPPGNTPQPGQDPSSQYTQVTDVGKKAFSIWTGYPVEAIPDYVGPNGHFSIDVDSMGKDEVDALRDALEQNMPLEAPAPRVLDLQYKASPNCR